MSHSSTTDTLIQLHVDGMLTSAQAAELDAMVAQSSDIAAELVQAMYLDAFVTHYHRVAPLTTIGRNSDPAAERLRVRWPSVWSLAVTAMIALAALVSIVFYVGRSSERSTTSPGPATPPVAMLTNIDHVVFAEGSEPMTLGGDLKAGPVRLLSGAAQIMFSSTAVVDLIGPCEFEMTGSNRGRLVAGRLKAYVPDHARGFTVELPDGSRIVDLGTAFAADVTSAGRQTLRVTKGAVELHHAGSVTPLPAGHGARYADGRWTFVDTAALGVAEHSDNVELLPFAPDSVEADSLESDTKLFVFRERTGVVIETGDRAAITRPGSYTSSTVPGGELPVGALADSFFLHFDGPGDRPEPAVIDASITFDRPILGIITGGGLPEVNRRFAGPDTRYTDDRHRGIEPGDTVTLSDDRRTLTVHLVSYRPDQLRVIVEAATNRAHDSPPRRPPTGD